MARLYSGVHPAMFARANEMTIDNGYDDKHESENNSHENGGQYEGNGSVAVTSFSTVKR